MLLLSRRVPSYLTEIARLTVGVCKCCAGHELLSFILIHVKKLGEKHSFVSNHFLLLSMQKYLFLQFSKGILDTPGNQININ